MADDRSGIDITVGGSKGVRRGPAPVRGGAPAPVGKNGAQKKKKKSKLLFKLIILGAVIIIIAGAAFVVAMNYFGARDAVFDAIYSLDPRNSYAERIIKTRLEDIETRSQELVASETEFNERVTASEAELEAERQRLESLQSLMDQRDEEITQRELEAVPIYRRPMNEQQLADIQSLAGIYSQMPPENAAEILSSLYDAQNMAAILYHMTDRSAASVLAAMDVGLAAEITEILLHE